MRNAITAEFMKLRRSRALLLAAAACVLPPAVKCLRHVFGGSGGASGWQEFLTSGQELAVFGMLITVILLASHLFTMEYRYGTAAAICTTGTGRLAIYAAKLAALGAVIAALSALSWLSNVLLGVLAAGQMPPAGLLGQFSAVTAWFAFCYILLAAVVALFAVWTKRFVLTAVITLGYYILIFPFHTKNPYVCPFMTPAVVAAKLYGSTGYIFNFSYDNLTAGVLPAAAFLLVLAGLSLAAGMWICRRSDAVRQPG